MAFTDHEGPQRNVVVTEFALARIDQALKSYPRLQNLWDAIRWKLARRPKSGTMVPDRPGYYLAKTVSWAPGGLAIVSVLYRITDSDIIIESARIDWPKKGRRG